MHRFRVWAPAAKQVEIKIGEVRTALKPIDGGWWEVSIDSAGPGTDYAYILDGQEPAVPDPRSEWQPTGVHGPSRVVDHSAFQWSDTGWEAPEFASGVVYELHVGTFTPEGTLDALIPHLDYLKDLGVTHVELLPLAAFPGIRGWGYDGVDLFAVHQPYGGPEALKRFVDAAHGKGLAVLLDVVYNHFGPSGSYVGKFGPYFTPSHTTPWGDAVNLEDAGSHEVRRFFCDNALMWLRDYHIDGLRLDAVHAYMDRSAINFMEQLAEEVGALETELGKQFVLIAESDLNDPRLVKPVDEGGYGLDAAWSDDFHHALVTVLTGEREGYYADFGSVEDLAKSLEHIFVYDGQYSPYRNRTHGRSADGLPGWKFLGYSQNHDQVGNRAQGDRLSHIAGDGGAKIAAALVLTAPFVPMLFQGEEFASSAPFQYFTAHEDAELGRLVSEGRKREFVAFGWSPEDIPDPQAEETFNRSKLDWAEVDREPHRSMLQWYRALIRLRRETPELNDGQMDEVNVRLEESGQARRWISVQRGPVQVVCNLGTEPYNMRLPAGAAIALKSTAEEVLNGEGITLPANAVVVIKTDK
ncbi:MAG TPA: malto-oligosyltrehalose trehalohydrolase [Acidisarcina sp.]